MTTSDAWLPELVVLADFDGDWDQYIDAVYDWYLRDLGGKRVLFRGKPIALRHHPPSKGKGSGFWHCTQEGAIEEDRTPDLERCKRIRWIKAIIENSNEECVDYWQEVRGSEINHLLWWRETYLIVLAERGDDGNGGPEVYLLKTAYLITREHQKRKKRASRDAWVKANAAH